MHVLFIDRQATMYMYCLWTDRHACICIVYDRQAHMYMYCLWTDRQLCTCIVYGQTGTHVYVLFITNYVKYIA